MKTKARERYYYKMLYFNAGRNLMKSNFEYYSGSMSDRRIESACSTITAMKKSGSTIYLKDITGCCRDAVLKNISNKYIAESDIYVYSDDRYGDIRLKAVYICSDSTMLCGCNSPAEEDEPVVDLSCCYKSKTSSIRSYPPENIAEVAKFFFDKSSTCCLCCENSEY